MNNGMMSSSGGCRGNGRRGGGRGNGQGMGKGGRGVGQGGINDRTVAPGMGTRPMQEGAQGFFDDDHWASVLDRDTHRVRHVAQMQEDIARSPREPLTAAEREGLLLMREEEKIARDVYMALGKRWGNIRPFSNITGAEQAHMDAILILLQHYDLPDPAAGLAVGKFHNPELQRLHDALVQQGLRSQEEAIRVGLLIEELDIDDLQKAAKQTDKAAIHAVYAELERGSRNHLRAFYRWKEGMGISYQPQHLTPELFKRLALSPHEDCVLE